MIRDEISKIIDVRIPPNGYRRYIKEIARTGGFQQRQHEDSLIVMFQAIEDLEKKVAELEREPVPSVSIKEHPYVALRDKSAEEEFVCGKCGMKFDQKLGLMGHSRKKDHQDAITNTTKPDPKEPVQSE